MSSGIYIFDRKMESTKKKLAAKKKKTPNTTPTKPQVGQLITKNEPLKSFPIRLVADPIKSQSTQRDFAYVNVKTMKEYGLAIGAGVFLYSSDKQGSDQVNKFSKNSFLFNLTPRPFGHGVF